MKKTYSQRGFTLIELLVVIAIIGILSSVVLASLSTARNKGKVAAIKSQMASLRSQVELQANGGNYGAVTGGTGVGSTGACAAGTIFGSTGVTAIVTGINNNNPTTNLTCSTDSATNATVWAASVILPDGSGSYCVDSSGNAKSKTSTTLDTTVQNNGVCQ